MNKWFEKSGAENDVAVSSRIRLARNLRKYPFPAHLDDELKKEVNRCVKDALFANNQYSKYSYIRMENVNDRQAKSFVEQHLISPAFAGKRNSNALILSEDESVSIMLNEEDHIRLQTLSAGLDLKNTYTKASDIDDELDSRLEYAFDDMLGYLTQCTTNLGTGMRASVMLHLPALQQTRQLPELSNMVSKLGLTIRGTYGEGTQARGGFYQLSNQVTLGISEINAIENLEGIARQVILQERAQRKRLEENANFVDKMWRTLGILKHARKLSDEEFVNLLSLVRLGASMHIFDIPINVIDTLISNSQPASILVNGTYGEKTENIEFKRSEMVRDVLASY